LQVTGKWVNLKLPRHRDENHHQQTYVTMGFWKFFLD
jgi:hypothetical protein